MKLDVAESFSFNLLVEYRYEYMHGAQGLHRFSIVVKNDPLYSESRFSKFTSKSRVLRETFLFIDITNQ